MEIHALPASGLLEHLRSGDLSSVEIVEALHRRADAVNGVLTALVHQFRDEALQQARRADEARARGEWLGPLHGLPITIKESIDTAGVASTLGLDGRRHRPATDDAVTVQLARRAGAIVLGKTNVPQTLLSPMETTNRIWGTTNNPWNLQRGPGGSSGGEAAGLASGLSPLGIGTDIGGSIRLPATFCGVCGLKPTADRWSNAGSNTALAGQEAVRAQIGPMARTSDDVALLLRALDTPLHAPFDPRVPPAPIRDPDEVDIEGLRVGFYEDDGYFTPAASCRRAVREAAEALHRAGAEVVPFAPSNVEEVTYLYFAALSSDGGATLSAALGKERVVDPLKTLWRVTHLPDPARRLAAKTLRALGERRVGRLLENLGRKGVERLWELTARRTVLQLDEIRQWDRERIDVVLAPAHVTSAAPHGYSHDFTLGFCYVARYNVLNFPAGVVPVTRVRADETERQTRLDRLDRRAADIQRGSEGLPVGVQVVGRPWREDVVLAAMRAAERGLRDGDDYPATPVDPR